MFTLDFKDKGLVQRLTAITEDQPPNLLPQMRESVKRMRDSVLTNFREGGRPKWTPTKAGNHPLMGRTERLYHSVGVSEITPTSARVSAGQGLVYAFIHQFGGTIHHPGSSKLQVFKADGKTVFTRYTKPHQIKIPQRKYMLFQRSDVSYIKNLLIKRVFGEKQ